ncbi:DUF4113 domain-containing protein [Cytophagaceae bacterium SJW1-29]|uniref:DUF4113 domain-containing protein n=1 Tax=Salmonirosea aquatica TaxID=2654236 RepID=A0A7C9FQP6_9BACT|nr:DUF4113 domain-containing protein [Cytophagaceae bacterium SJW1-29]
MAVLDRLNQRMGATREGGAMGFDRSWLMRQERKSKCPTTRWAFSCKSDRILLVL